jgi:hypothetical protein
MEIFEIQKKCFSLTFYHRNLKFEKVFKLIQPIFLAIFAYTVALQLIYVCLNIRDVMEAAESFGLFATAFLGLIKTLTFYFYMETFYDFMEKLRKMSNEGLIKFFLLNQLI